MNNGKEQKEGSACSGKSEQFQLNWEHIFHAVGHATLVLNLEHIIVMANDAAIEATGMPRDELLGKKCYEVFHASGHPPESCPLEILKESDQMEIEAMEMEALSGTYLVSCTPVFDEDGNLENVIHIATDITKRKKAEEKLQESEDRLSKILLAANDGIWDWDLETDEVFFDSRYYEMAGYTVDAFPHRLEEFQKRVHPDDIEYVMNQAWKHLEGDIERFIVEFRFKKKTGDWMWIKGRGKIVERDEDGGPLRFVGTHTDITQQRQAEEKYRMLVEHSIQGVVIAQKDPIRISFASKPMEQITGYSCEKLKSFDAEQLKKLIHPEDRTTFFNNFQARLSGKKLSPHAEYRIIHENGDARWVELFSTVIDYQGSPATQTVFIDITDRKKAERQYRDVVEHAHDAIYTIHPKKGFQYVNPAFEELTGYSTEEIYNEDFSFWDIIHPDDVAMIRERGIAREHGEEVSNQYEFRIITKDDTTKILEATTVEIGMDDEGLIMGILRDVTQRKQAEQERTQYIDELQFIANTIIKVSRMQDIDEICQLIAEQIHGINKNSVVAVSLYDPVKETIAVRAVEGLGDRTRQVFKLFGGDPTKQTIRPEDLKDSAALFTSGKLEQIPGGLHELMGGRLPRIACTAAEKLFGIDAVYTVGFAFNNQLQGGISLFVPKGHELKHKQGIETVASHVSTVLHRQQAEQERMRAMIEMERALDLEKRFKADAAHFFLNPIAISKGYMDLAIEEMSEDCQERIQASRNAIKRIETVIKNIVEKGEIYE